MEPAKGTGEEREAQRGPTPDKEFEWWSYYRDAICSAPAVSKPSILWRSCRLTYMKIGLLGRRLVEAHFAYRSDFPRHLGSFEWGRRSCRVAVVAVMV